MFHYKGNYKTKLRFKILDFVSREYDGSINEEQTIPLALEGKDDWSSPDR